MQLLFVVTTPKRTNHNVCKAKGIIQQYTVRYHSNQNVNTERLYLTQLNGMRSMLATAEIDKKYWPEAARSFTHTYNRSPHSANSEKTPYEIRHKKVPDVSYF